MKVSKGQIALCTTSTPMSAQYNAEMQEFTNLSYSTSEQHKELSHVQATLNRHLVDLEKIISKLSDAHHYGQTLR